MSALFAAAAQIQKFLRDADERFCFIGGIALQRWGEPRFTRDVDLTLLCPYGAEAQAADRLLACFAARIPEARAFALQHRVVLLRSASDVPIDVALGGIPFEERCVGRATDFDFGEIRLVTCSAEDLVVLKAFAGRDRDWIDIESVVIRQARSLDWALVFEELAPLAELRSAETMTRLQRLKQDFG
ncbi:MAG: nucleotidyl transferase AbiEii/AbiGii toxin family protein [Betaproteobacteria bacterium]|nr:nucleotidyl transferase AbiEii/AbiGii toxin family protein [Betaproteobacteria bacterium]